MSIRNLFILFILFIAHNINGQDSFNKIECKLVDICALEDVNERKYQLSLLVNSFKNQLTSSVEEYSLADTTVLRMAKSSDSKYTVYYYNTPLEEAINRLDWFIVYGKMGEKQVVHFKKEMALKGEDKNAPKCPFFIEIMPLDKGDINIYPLTISHSSSMKIYKQYVDIASICMFERLLSFDSDSARLAQNEKLEQRLSVIFDDTEYFNNDFEGLQRLSTLRSEDGKVKVCTWNLELNESDSRFYGSIMTMDNNNEVEQIPLQDKTEIIRSPSKAQLNNKKWYGAVYYDIVMVKDKPTNYYLLIGYKPCNEMTKKKVVDALVMGSNKQVRFGKSVFQNGRYVEKRLIYEFSASVNMMLRYERNNKRIVLDHLAPSSPLYKDNYRFYGPDFSYDAYTLEKDRWTLQNEVDVRNPKAN